MYVHVYVNECQHVFVGSLVQSCIQCTYGIFSREITVHSVKYGVYIQFWPTLHKLTGGFILASDL